MTAPATISDAEIQRALAAMSSLAVVASALPTAAVYGHLVDEHAAAVLAGEQPRRPLVVLCRIAETCEQLGQLGDELQAAIAAEQSQEAGR